MANQLSVVHEEDPRDTYLKLVMPAVERLSVMGARVLVSVYVRPERKKGSAIILPGVVRDEDRYQGKVGLVVALGPLAFKEDETHRFGGRIPQVGDWVQFRVPESFPFELTTEDGKREYSRARYVEDVDIYAILTDPDLVF